MDTNQGHVHKSRTRTRIMDTKRRKHTQTHHGHKPWALPWAQAMGTPTQIVHESWIRTAENTHTNTPWAQAMGTPHAKSQA